MIIDRQPCPACEAPPVRSMSQPLSHRAEASSCDVTSSDGGPEFLHKLYFNCERCGARWVSDPARIERS